jgi:hypothetical protein
MSVGEFVFQSMGTDKWSKARNLPLQNYGKKTELSTTFWKELIAYFLLIRQGPHTKTKQKIRGLHGNIETQTAVWSHNPLVFQNTLKSNILNINEN